MATCCSSLYFLFVCNLRDVVSGEGEASDEVEMNREDLDDVADTSFGLQHGLDPQEFPFIEMEIIAEATDNFSELNKLGEGGFGPVFKVCF